MTLIKSISGIRGTIGGVPGDNLTPLDVLQFGTAFSVFLREKSGKDRIKVVIGRDARVSGEMINHLAVGTLLGMGVDVIDLGLSTTPTVEVAVPDLGADGGIILTASHNPAQWNALKLLNEKGEFISAADGAQLLALIEASDYHFKEYAELGKYTFVEDYIDKHIDQVLDLELVDVNAIQEAGFKVVVDCVNSTGGIALPPLLKRLGVEVIELYCEPNGLFPHNPEPLPENLTEISHKVVAEKADLGFVVDPDVDRLAIVMEDGKMFGEEYTLVAVSDYILQHTPGTTVSNLSSTRALKDVTEKAEQTYYASAVGEVNVVEMMKAQHAVIGGEGNGGIIYPASHYGRDALVGIALFLTYLAKSKMKCSALKNSYPNYAMSKNKIQLQKGMDVDRILAGVQEAYKQEQINTIDGVKIDFEDGWVHLRKSNTEPIIRVYSEGSDAENANRLASKVMKTIHGFIE